MLRTSSLRAADFGLRLFSPCVKDIFARIYYLMAKTEKSSTKLACKRENDPNQKVDKAANVHLFDEMRNIAGQLINQVGTKRNHKSDFRFLSADLKKVFDI